MFGPETQGLHALSSHRSHIILSPLSPNSINIQLPYSPLTKKRKYENISTEKNIRDSFDILIPSSSQPNRRLRLSPQLLISRLDLPLAFLDPVENTRELNGARLFSAQIPALELPIPSNGNSVESEVLLARSDSNSNLYAVEKAGDGLFALCKLNASVNLKDFEKENLQCRAQQRVRRYERGNFPGKEWWHPAAIDTKGNLYSNKPKEQEIGRFRGMHICLKPPTLEKSSVTPAENVPLVASYEQLPLVLDESADQAPLQSLSQDPEEVFDMIKSSYQEALYTSQGSLAYFAKGPLSRARASFQSNESSPPTYHRLSEFLRSCILGLPVLDKKYKETLPEVVNRLPTEGLTDDESGAYVEALRKKNRKPKKCKIGKNGLYPDEEINIAKWWMNRHSPFCAYGSVRDKENGCDQTRILLQKAREIQLQIILVLETIALELSVSITAIKRDGHENVVRDQIDPAKVHKPKKAKDLQVLLDLLIDRLCIWQSMNYDEVETAKGENKETHTSLGRSWNHQPGLSNLRDFCVDVVLPFYGARLPELSATLCRKLGGPKQPSPKRPSLSRAATCSQTSSRPGSALRRQPSQKPRRTLERILTDERIASRRPSPALSRSATDPMLPSLKREVSDVSMSSTTGNKVPLHKLRRYSQREVDLSAASQANEARLKKKAGVEKELQNAIAALKRPNARMAVKELIEDAEKRATSSRLTKVRNPAKNHSAQGVQVIVTPSVKRHKDVLGGLPHLAQTSKELPQDQDDNPPSSSLRVIASTPGFGSNKTKSRGQHLARPIEQTPTRGPLKLGGSASCNFLDIPQIDVADRNNVTPVKLKHSSKLPSMMKDTAFSFTDGVANLGMIDASTSNQENSGLETQHTLLKVPMVLSGRGFQEPSSSMVVDENNLSIYERLGWDDDIDDLC